MSITSLKDIPESWMFELAERLDRRGPRYTSYPTVPVWKSDFDTGFFQESLKRLSLKKAPIAIYLHLPYCKRRCFYCGCNSIILNNPEKHRQHIEMIKTEIDMVASNFPQGITHSQLHLGGGTPTHTPPELLAELLDYLLERMPSAKTFERSIEVDPRVTTDEHLKLLAGRGFTRISAGLQDLNADVQKAINRIYSFEQMDSFVKRARAHGFTGVNIDLIYGLPLQTRATWLKTLEEILKIGPDRLACFGYAHLPTKLKHQRAIKENDLPKSHERLGMLLDANRFFASNGFEPIGMDHFARPEDELSGAARDGRLWRNFMGYTANKGLELLGLGCSAISEFTDLYAQNAFPPEPYRQKILSGEFAIIKGWRLNRDDRIRKQLINNLMCNLEIKIPEHDSQLDEKTIAGIKKAMAELKPFEKEELIVPVGHGFKITPLGQMFLRNLAMPFDAYLRKESSTTFSKTV